VQIKEAKSLSGEIFTDNNRSPSIGSFQRGLRINQANLLGLGDGLEISSANTNGSNELNASYTLPINPHNGTIQFKGGFSNSNVIEPPFDSLNIVGHSRTYEFTYRQPLEQKPTGELALGVTFSRLESETSLLGEGFPLEPGANNQGEVRVSALRFFQDYVQRSPLQVFSARSQFSLGLDLFGSTINNNAPDSRFFSWRGQAQYVRQLAPKTLLLLRSDLQLANSSLLSLEQISTGGDRSVRGYRQDFLLTDNGFSASAEVRVPLLNLPEVPGLLQITPFLDFGVGWNYSGTQPNSTSNQLLGAGLGLLWQMGDRLTARLDYGIPLIDVHSSEQTWQEQGIYFTVSYSPL
jgi:hemolysin activation/secretion protein